ncbi:MAG: IS200/IS605 family transposase [bacterium]|nr:IS200/IS605 family transposase [bacterium]
MGHTFSKILLHVVFSTNGRRNFLYKDMRERLLAYLCGIARRMETDAVKAAAVDDHVHLLIKVGPTHSASDVVGKLKANSSRWVRKTFPRLADFEWQSGFAVFSVSQSASADVVDYLENQEVRHRRAPFEKELKALLEKHGIEFDPGHYLD